MNADDPVYGPPVSSQLISLSDKRKIAQIEFYLLRTKITKIFAAYQALHFEGKKKKVLFSCCHWYMQFFHDVGHMSKIKIAFRFRNLFYFLS